MPLHYGLRDWALDWLMQDFDNLVNFTYYTEIAAPTSVHKLKQRFCRDLSLAPESCTLSWDKQALQSACPSDQQVRQHKLALNASCTSYSFPTHCRCVAGSNRAKLNPDCLFSCQPGVVHLGQSSEQPYHKQQSEISCESGKSHSIGLLDNPWFHG